jgi:RNA polymerase sigma-70 factor (ECF subfamily)
MQPEPSTPRSPPPGAARFATTRWSVVLAAGHKSSPDSRRALESLCRAYWYPLYGYARRRVATVEEAQDLTQAFFTELLEKDYLLAATPERGRFRSFLLTAFKHFLAKEWEKARAQKRGGGRASLPLDFEGAERRYGTEPCAGLTAEQLYERQWAVSLLHQILDRLRDEAVQGDKGELFDVLKDFLIGEHADTTYAEAAARLELSEAAARMAAARMRRRYRELLREEIAQTVAGADEVEDEIRRLFTTLAG